RPLPGGRRTPAVEVKGTSGQPMVSGTDAAAADVTSSFGWRKDPFSGAAKFHAGVDIRAAYGRDVMTAGAGRVVSAGVQGGYGQSVVVEHAPGLRTRYAHLSSIDVTPGQVVEGGSVVGKVGQSGRATGPHLHFEVLEHGKAVNPDAGGRLLAAALKGSAAGADYPNGSAGTRATLSGAEE
ncbi:MAG: M23 family metallopeptidase, partial [Vicinamibacterales bacterium]